MNRLTDRNKEIQLPCTGNGVFWARVHEKLARYEDTGLEPEEVRGIKTAYDEVQIPYEVVATGADAARVIRLLDAEDEGRLLVLPCKVGDTVYIVDRGEILEEKVIGFCTFNKKSFNKKSGEPVTAMTASYGHYVTQPNINAIGVLNGENQLSFFFTREDAEKALEGTKNDER